MVIQWIWKGSITPGANNRGGKIQNHVQQLGEWEKCKNFKINIAAKLEAKPDYYRFNNTLVVLI